MSYFYTMTAHPAASSASAAAAAVVPMLELMTSSRHHCRLVPLLLLPLLPASS
jgi:hypothetical protein